LLSWVIVRVIGQNDRAVDVGTTVGLDDVSEGVDCVDKGDDLESVVHFLVAQNAQGTRQNVILDAGRNGSHWLLQGV
jgi:hypothetical protein